jgi:hypothetical protein
VPVVTEFARVVRGAGMARPDAEALSLAVCHLVSRLETAGVSVGRTPRLVNPLVRMAGALRVPVRVLGL